MVTSTNTIYGDFRAFIARKGEPLSKWYVGTTAEVYQSLFVEHYVSEHEGNWIYKQCANNQSAKNVKLSLMRLGCDGKAGGWDESINIVYAYLKSPGTKP